MSNTKKTNSEYAYSLKKALKELGYDVQTTHCHEAIARTEGFRSYNHMVGTKNKPENSQIFGTHSFRFYPRYDGKVNGNEKKSEIEIARFGCGFSLQYVWNAFDGETIYSLICTGGHAANYVVTIAEPDSPIKTWEFNHGWDGKTSSEDNLLMAVNILLSQAHLEIRSIIATTLLKEMDGMVDVPRVLNGVEDSFALRITDQDEFQKYLKEYGIQDALVQYYINVEHPKENDYSLWSSVNQGKKVKCCNGVLLVD